MIIIPLTKGYSAVIDDEDEDLARYNWATLSSGGGQYAARRSSVKEGRKYIYLHREIMSRKVNRALITEDIVDHIDGNVFNNMRENLRLVDASGNAKNRSIRKDNRTGFKGVASVGKRFSATVFSDGVRHYLGMFDSAEEASEAYRKASLEIHGKHSRMAVNESEATAILKITRQATAPERMITRTSKYQSILDILANADIGEWVKVENISADDMPLIRSALLNKMQKMKRRGVYGSDIHLKITQHKQDANYHTLHFIKVSTK